MAFDLPAPVKNALCRLQAAGFSAYVVGGCVRDWVLGIPPHDYDICTSALPAETQRVFRGERTVETGLRHGTLTVILSGMPLEITTFRQDGEYLDGRHPASVRFTPRVEEDLARRDFTINAMAYAPESGLTDPFGGREDCRAGMIRCVGEAEARFSEDALRILRALRFSARLGFPLEDGTARAARRLRASLNRISRERVAAELTGLLMGRDAPRVMGDFADVVAAALPELAPLAPGGRWTQALTAVGLTPREEALRWAALLMACGETPEESADVARRALQGLKMPVRLTETAAELVLWHQAKVTRENMQEMLCRLGPERLAQLLLLQKAGQWAAAPENARQTEERYRALEEARARLVAEHACCSLGQLQVNGRDLGALGLRGPEIGAALNALLLAVARGEVENEKAALLGRITARRES